MSADTTANTTAETDTISTAAWPGLHQAPRGPRARVSAAIARRIFAAGTARLGITWSQDGTPADIMLHRPEEFFARVGSDGLIGFGESYLTGAWDAPELGEVLTVLCSEIAGLVPGWMQRMRGGYVRRPPRHQRNSEANSRRNIAHHYDLSNDLFRAFLDPTMSYSSAMFDTESVTRIDDGVRVTTLEPPRPGTPLAEAQGRKIERILDAAAVGPQSRVLEIGTGWGELAIRAARRGASVRSITLSVEQQRLARERIDAAAAAEGWDSRQVQVDLLDYRALTAANGHEVYDAVVSVEMIEAVGYQYWQTYFETLDAVLAPGGTAVVQAITMPHDRMLATRNTYTWINKYIFPGGFLPSTEAIEAVTRQHTGLRLRHRVRFGSHYAETLRRWDATFAAAAEEVRGLGFDETFLRMWHFYLEYSRAGFAAGYIDVQQLTFTREG